MGAWNSFIKAFQSVLPLDTQAIENQYYVSRERTRDPRQSRVRRLGQAITNANPGEFEDPTIDLDEIGRAYHTDSYIRRAIDKYVDLMFKAGWEITGRNEEAAQYVWTRMKIIAEASKEPTEKMMNQLAYDYVLYGNAYLVKQRQSSRQTIPGMNLQGYSGNRPIAGYFVLPAQTMRIMRDQHGQVQRYEQDTGDGEVIEFRAEDIVHFHYKRPTGRGYGIPFVYNVLDDVKVLRQMEESIIRLVHRNLFPVYLYTVGTDKPGQEATPNEIEELREEIREMPMEGALVVPERHDIKTVGSEGAALDGAPYLKYFRQRVFSGLGVSDSVMGIGETENRSSSDNQSAALHDGVKEFQRSFGTIFQKEVVNELLFEAGYDPILEEDDEVLFNFFEIQLDAKIKKENHAVQLFMQNAITHEEMRQYMGKDPIGDEGRLFANMFNQVKHDEESASNQGENDDQPENQHGTQNSPGENTKKGTFSEKEEENSRNLLTEAHQVVNLRAELSIQSYEKSLLTLWHKTREDIIALASQDKPLEDLIAFTNLFASTLMKNHQKKKSEDYVIQAINLGFRHASEELEISTSRYEDRLGPSARKIISYSNRFVDALAEDLVHLIEKAYGKSSKALRLSYIRAAFDSNEYRLGFIAQTESFRGYNYGKAVIAQDIGLESVPIRRDKSCKTCRDLPDTVSLSSQDLIEAIPPHHPCCDCTIDFKKEEVSA